MAYGNGVCSDRTLINGHKLQNSEEQQEWYRTSTGWYIGTGDVKCTDIDMEYMGQKMTFTRLSHSIKV